MSNQEFNSYDYADAPRFKPLGKKRPERKPLLALQEVLEKYVPRFVRGIHERDAVVGLPVVVACAQHSSPSAT